MQWWLVTWSTYASWLPGDPRGFQTWRGREYVPPPVRYAKPGEKTYVAADYAQRHAAAKAYSGAPVRLTREERQTTLDAVIAEIDKLHIRAAVIAVGGEHSHLLAKFGKLDIRRTVGFLKGEATKALRETASRGNCEEIWSANCHMKSKREGIEFISAFKYVKKHIDEGAIVSVWPAFSEFAH
jgi:hypothetical protein